MNSKQSRLVLLAISLGAGAGDVMAGCALLAAPQWLGHILGDVPLQASIFLRYLGVFVGCVGLSYFYGLLAWKWSGQRQRLAVVWELTSFFRLAVALFLVVAVATSQLNARWLAISAVDGSWALLQLYFILTRNFDEKPD